MGCLWYLTAVLTASDDVWVNRYGFQDYSDFDLYLLSIYYTLITLTTVGYGDISSVTLGEQILSILYMFFGVAFYSYFIGMLTSVLQFLGIQEAALKKNIAVMNEYCNEMNIN
jgi:hypothetical protein